MVDWSWIISQITFWSPPINRSEDGGDQYRGEEEDHLASTEMQRVPSLVEEKYLGAAIWVRRPTESALNILVTISSSCQFHVCIYRVVGCDGIGSGWNAQGLGFQTGKRITGWWGGVWGGLQVGSGVVWVLIDVYLGRMLGKPGGLAGRQHRILPSLLLASLDPDPDWVELE